MTTPGGSDSLVPGAAGTHRAPLPLTGAWVASAAGGTIVSGDPDRVFAGVSIDTRTLQSGALYVGVRGERFDGAQFAGAAIAAGAAGVMVPAAFAPLESHDAVVIAVEDGTAALQALGRAVRRSSGATVVAITGSAGKTTTKEIAAEFLAERYHVMRNRGNFNNHIGLPLSLIELTARPDIAVVELGMNHAGEIRTLVDVAEPDVRVWTNVGEAHLGHFASLDAIADAKAEILEGASASNLLVANADDARIAERTAGFTGRTVTFGIDADADVRATDVVDRGIEGTRARMTTRTGSVALATPLIGRSNLANVLAAAAVATELGIPLDAIAARASTLRPAAHRGEVVRLRDGVTLIDDSYNANPTATRRALDVLGGASGASRRIAVLGEMLELGDRSTALHEEIGRGGGEGRGGVVLRVGAAPAAALADAAIASGVARERVQHFSTSEEAAEAAASLVKAGDLVLIKGSRGVRTDRIVDRLKAERG
jgi:UDP-N-acetylmuramoyl-tripeptide--D-alanyl-D-alanine ligase